MKNPEIRKRHLEICRSLDHRMKISKSNKNKKRTKIAKENYSLSMKKRWQEPKYRARWLGENNPLYGKKRNCPWVSIRNKKFIGENNPNWQGGISFKPYSPEFNEQLKLFIRQRDNFTCQFPNCNLKENGHAHIVHHTDYNKKNCNPNNLILLCNIHNSKVNFNREYWESYFRQDVVLTNKEIEEVKKT